jgi:asparagine synthase (glutamine-hydrolysing)
MCGIAGIVGSRLEGLEAMSARLYHRGPDDFGHWSDADAGVGLSHRRLSILDLSPAGHQPMHSLSGRFVIIFNGEIYNHLEIRKELENSGGMGICCWRGHSDTETLLACFDSWGIEDTLRRCIGMFALAVWDKSERTLTLTRDRMGEKPLYYGWNRGVFLFASELKALHAFPGFDVNINRDAITLLLRHNCIPTPYSIYRGIFKLWPGAMLSLRHGAATACPWELDSPPLESFRSNSVSLSWYWSLKDVAEKCQSHPFTGTEREAVDELERILGDAVQAQQISDVPLGAFLSGGVDSSLIAALMQARATRPVKTFTIGFHEATYNEAGYAKEVARHLGTDHTELYVTPEEAQTVIPRLSAMYDEPFSDVSQIPTFLVARMARRHVTVTLSGDAGDELFGGYNRYFLTRKIQRMVKRLPLGSRSAIARLISAFSPAAWDRFYSYLEPLLPSNLRVTHAGDKTRKLLVFLTSQPPEEIYRFLVSHWKTPADTVVGAVEPATILTKVKLGVRLTDFEHRMMFIDSLTYLPDDILVKVDRAAMAVSLETRVPFLDHRVVEFAWRLPLSLKIRNGQGKWILRQVLYNHVPKELIERPKQGFAIPLHLWLRGSLREWAESLLNEGRLRREGYFHPELIRQKWREHLSGACNWQDHLWDVLMFQAWLENNRP